MNPKNAFDLHQELAKLDSVIGNIENAMYKTNQASESLEDTETPNVMNILSSTAFLYSSNAMEESLAYFKQRKQEIETALSSSYFLH